MTTDNIVAPSKGEVLYLAWKRGIGVRDSEVTPWADLESGTRSTWTTYGDDPATIGTANEPWARSVLAKAVTS